MYCLETIKQMNIERAKEAKQLDLEPLVYDGIPETLRKIPNLGDYRATKFGWKMVNTYFVDSSGMGRVGESALTFGQFIDKAKVGRGYAIIEAGQFQVHIGEFVKN